MNGTLKSNLSNQRKADKPKRPNRLGRPGGSVTRKALRAYS
jgi:hypothetical protein